MRYAFIRSDLAGYPAGTCCRALGVSRSGYYAWRDRPEAARRARRRAPADQVRAVHDENRRAYGSPRVWRALRAAGGTACENTVARVMREHGVRARPRRRHAPRTTDSAHGGPVAPNLLGRDFAADAPDRKWAADITYVPTGEGWLYLAGVLDLYSRKVVGWAMADHLRADLPAAALRMAVARRRPAAGLVHHSDRGCQYASEGYRGLLAAHGMAASMSGRGDCWDNAPAESFWATLKAELVDRDEYATRAEAEQSIFEYVEVFYNRKRLHSSIGYQSPEAFEAGSR